MPRKAWGRNVGQGGARNIFPLLMDFLDPGFSANHDPGCASGCFTDDRTPCGGLSRPDTTDKVLPQDETT